MNKSTLMLTLLIAIPAFGGTVKVTGMLAGSTATLELKDADGATLLKQDMADANGDGMVEFGFIGQDKVKDVLVWKTNTDSVRIHYDAKITLGSLPGLEPFFLPTFAALDPSIDLFTIIDVNALLASVNPFTPGEIIPITNGSTPLSSAVTFKDATGFDFPSTPDPFDLALIATFPDFTGDARVDSPDQFVPEPSTMTIFSIAGLSLALATKRRRLLP